MLPHDWKVLPTIPGFKGDSRTIVWCSRCGTRGYESPGKTVLHDRRTSGDGRWSTERVEPDCGLVVVREVHKR